MIENRNPFPLKTLGFETHCSNFLTLYIHIFPLLELFDIELQYKIGIMFQNFTQLVPFFFSYQKIMIKNQNPEIHEM
jgi:hypothetical protein